jgi:hypothetical protein
MAIVHLVCLMASHEWKDASQVVKSQILYLSSNQWIIFVTCETSFSYQSDRLHLSSKLTRDSLYPKQFLLPQTSPPGMKFGSKVLSMAIWVFLCENLDSKWGFGIPIPGKDPLHLFNRFPLSISYRWDLSPNPDSCSRALIRYCLWRAPFHSHSRFKANPHHSQEVSRSLKVFLMNSPPIYFLGHTFLFRLVGNPS